LFFGSCRAKLERAIRSVPALHLFHSSSVSICVHLWFLVSLSCDNTLTSESLGWQSALFRETPFDRTHFQR
jgi:hypothetical protein